MTAPMPSRRSIRFAIVAVVCLLLGAVTTVGVAWWLAWEGPSSKGSPSVTLVDAQAAKAGWPDGESSGWPPPTSVTQTRMPGLDVVIAQDAPPTLPPDDRPVGYRILPPPHVVWVERYGWPGRAVQLSRGQVDGKAFGYPPRNHGWTFNSWRSGLFWVRETPNSYDMTQFPLRPIFPGFAVDTGVYAAAWWVVIFAPHPLYRAGRRRFRVSRGMCGSCGYDLKGSSGSVCPECGRTAGAKE